MNGKRVLWIPTQNQKKYFANVSTDCFSHHQHKGGKIYIFIAMHCWGYTSLEVKGLWGLPLPSCLLMICLLLQCSKPGSVRNYDFKFGPERCSMTSQKISYLDEMLTLKYRPLQNSSNSSDLSLQWS